MKRTYKGVGIYLIIVLIVLYFALTYKGDQPKVTKLTFSDLISAIQQDRVKTFDLEGLEFSGSLVDNSRYEGYIPAINIENFYDNYLKEKVESGKIVYNGGPERQTPFYFSLITPIIMLAAFAVFWYFFMQQSQGGGPKPMGMGFGRSRAKRVEVDGKKIITFSEVAGLKEEKEEMREIVDFLKSPRKYVEIGARIPTGVLLVGPPGTGKTYLSKAVAGEANVPFFTISGSDFVEMFVGVGASRVRDLFEEAKRNSPCIVFIDEIDAVGRRRGAGMGGGHDEREQTLNQLLVEMDGFSKNEGIIVMAATNRADILDPALLRPGRFDRQIYVGVPDVRERAEILKVHTRKKPLADDVDLEVIAKRTPGFSPADLENMINEAAILSARENLKKIPMRLINEASIKVQAGPEKKSRVVIEKERKLTAYHEAGHAVVARLCPESDPIHMVTIVPRGMAGGFTAYVPDEDRSYSTKGRMKTKLITLLGGRAAEAVILDDISTGAQNDIERATKIARSMVTHYGMSDRLAPMTYGSDEDEVFLGRDFTRARNYSELVAAEIDKEMRGLIDEAYKTATSLLKTNIERLHRVAQKLLEKETISGKEFEALFEGVAYDPSSENSVSEENEEEVREEIERTIEERIRAIEQENLKHLAE